MFAKMRMRANIVNVFFFLLVLVGAFIAFVPLYWLVRSSLMSDTEIFIFPPKLFPDTFLWDNYYKAMTVVPFGKYFVNTFTIIIPVILGTVVTSSLAAYAFARLKFPLKSLWFGLIISSMLIPYVITLIPIFIAWTNLGMVNTYMPLILPAWLGGGAYNIFLLRQFMLSIPKDLDEAATIDGAGPFRILFSIILPLVKPALIAICLFTFMNTWNDLLGPVVYLNDGNKYTVAIGLSQFKGVYRTSWNMLMAASVVVVSPAILLFFLGQKQFVEGITITGMKA